MTDCLARPNRYEPAMMSCDLCRLTWHKEDPERPTCRRETPPLKFPNHAVIPDKPAKFCSGLPQSAHFR
jgi:hypothetical protein